MPKKSAVPAYIPYLRHHGLMKRHPFKRKALITESRGETVMLERADMVEEWGLSDTLKVFLEANATCARCGQAATDMLSHDDCPHDRKYEPWDGVLALLLHRDHSATLSEMFWKESQRNAAFKRTLRLRRGGTHTGKDVALLFNLQEGRCFYCAALLQGADGPMFHKDHYVPLAMGGHNRMGNIVLACAACNGLKHADHGEIFVAHALLKAAGKDRACLRRMHQAVYKWWAILSSSV